MPKVCVSLWGGPTGEVAARIREQDRRGADLIEVRFDYAESPLDPRRLRAETKKPLIATCRIASEGGGWRGSEEERIRILLEAAEHGFDYVDLEASAPRLRDAARSVQALGRRLIVSHHDFERSLAIPEMEEMLESVRGVLPDVVKIVGYAHHSEDNVAYLGLLLRHPGNVAFAMGPLGGLSRVACPLVGGAWTYASPGVGEECAPGQLTLKQIRGVYKALGVED